MYIDDITRLVVGRRAAFLRFLLSVSDLGRQIFFINYELHPFLLYYYCIFRI